MDGSYGLNASTPNKEAALKVLAFAATPRFGTIFSNVTGEMTAVKGATLPKDKLILQECYKTANSIAAANTYWVGSVFQNGSPNVYSILREKCRQCIWVISLLSSWLRKYRTVLQPGINLFNDVFWQSGVPRSASI